jgi:ribose-phosphate pyrophosphokinase
MSCTVLNLVSLEQSEVKYKVSKFPDGQQSIEILNADKLIDINMPIPVRIKSRLNSFQDLELIICATQALKNLRFSNIELYVPYFLGARSDRQFTGGSINYLKQVICPIINSQGYSKVYVVDPHSDVLEACLNNFAKFTNNSIVEFALDKLKGRSAQTALVSPDAGAIKKIYDIAKDFNINNVTTAVKVRDIQTGNIIRTELPTMDLTDIEHVIIVDDICDGGRTFIELAKEIKKQTDKPIYLIVTHGIFSGGFEKLSDELDGIFCTNSVKDINFETVKVQSRQNDSNFVKQLNIF